MNKKTVLLALDELLEYDPGTLEGNEQLEGLDGWDSLAVIGLIAIADEQFNIALSPADIQKAETINDVVALLLDNAA